MPILVSVLAYFIGAIPFGVIFSRMKGVDIFSSGSGNPGFTNVLRTMGLKIGLIVLFCDMLKGTVSTYFGFLLYGDMGMMLGFAFALIGHSLSPFINFKGGKGIATAAGGLLFISPLTFLLAALTVLIPAFITRYMSVGAILSALCCPFYLYLADQSKLVIITIGLLSLYVIFLHRTNIVRLIQGRENKIQIGKGK